MRTSNDRDNLLYQEAWPRITYAFLSVIKEQGTTVHLDEDDALFKIGDSSYDFAFIE
ncbi:hypothetical protein U6A24_06520 [Aquimarina gracilis]|uniref:Uncharacterized protein n=1 Tax=Aquimarina gracilis TaxID=874422 RepID=A0ABU5ZSQ1_9FLAO|nr:hypothetical protein [Aquimarina gracilis]MEB3345104.1 hypothetical protein [Aquimarina gracilis]